MSNNKGGIEHARLALVAHTGRLVMGSGRVGLGRVGVFFILLFILNVPVDRGDEEEVREARALRTRCVDAEAMGGSEAKRMGRRYWSYGEKRLRRFRGVMGSKYSNSE